MSSTAETTTFDIGNPCETLGCNHVFQGRGRCAECRDITPVPIAETYENVDWSNTANDRIPSDLNDRKQWMGATAEKRPFAPWTDEDSDAYCSKCDTSTSDCEHHAGWKWSYEGNYVTGSTLDTKLHQSKKIDSRAFIQLEDDPFSHVDFDDVINENGNVHPAVPKILDALGRSYTELSQSGGGIHVLYHGELPDGVKQASWNLDTEPFDDNEDCPSIEIYDGKRVCVTTGNHVRGTLAGVHGWDINALYELLDEHGQLPHVSTPTDEYDDFNANEYVPDVTGRGTTTNIEDIFVAINRLDTQQVAEKTIVHRWNDGASTSNGARAFYPTWSPNNSGTANIITERGWDYTNSGGYGGPVVMALLDMGVVDQNTVTPHNPVAKGENWWRGVEHLRKLGFEIPKYVSLSEEDCEWIADYIAFFRGIDVSKKPTWDYGGLTQEGVWNRTTRIIKRALETDVPTLIEALPSTGKSTGLIKAIAETDIQTTVFTARHDLYDDYRKRCKEYGLDDYELPSLYEYCPTINGEHGSGWEHRVRDAYQNGWTGSTIHTYDAQLLGGVIPCERGEGHECSYKRKWNFDSENYKVMTGNYKHAYNPNVSENRTAVIDESPTSDFVESFDSNTVTSVVNKFLHKHDGIPFADRTDLIQNRDDDERYDEAIGWFRCREGGLDRDTSSVLREKNRSDDGHERIDATEHALAPLMTYALLDGHDLENGWEHSSLDLHANPNAVAARNRGATNQSDELHVFRPPDFSGANGVVCLDGTPSPKMWSMVVGEDLNHEQVLSDEERREYLTNVLGITIIQTTDATNVYSNADNINVEKDGALFDAVYRDTGVRPSLITSMKAAKEYAEADVLSSIDDVETLDDCKESDKIEWYGNFKGTNKFENERVGIVSGTQHYGDGFIKMWCAFANESVERVSERGGADLEYSTELGNEVLKDMREHEVLQAILRFERGNGHGATVLVNTSAIPDWVPIAHKTSVNKVSDGTKQCVVAINEIGSTEFTKTDVSNHPLVSISKRQVESNLNTLTEWGVLESVECDRQISMWTTTNEFTRTFTKDADGSKV